MTMHHHPKPVSGTQRSFIRHAGLGRWAALALAGVVLSGCVVAPAHSPRYERVPAVAAPEAAPMYFYPAQNQAEPQQERDRYECYRWAVAQTGMDPGMTPVRQTPVSTYRTPPPNGAEVASGAVTGAVVGSMVSPYRHSGQGAVIGALFGAMVGAASQDAQQRAYEQSRARQAANADASARPMNNFRRAMSACMEGRGYRVQ
jgi:hypothetical protein